MSSSPLLDSLSRDAGEFSRLAAGGPADAPIPSCPGWTVADLVGHLGSVHRWATSIVRSGQYMDEEPPPAVGVVELLAWFDDGARSLAAALRAAGPGNDCWTFGPQPRRAGFWIRRQAHETALHLWDLRSALRAPGAMDTALAADGVDEVVRVFVPRQVRLERIPPLPGAIRLVDGETGRSWFLGGDGTSPDGPPAGMGATEVAATVSGRPEDLLLALWRRVDLGDAAVTVTGDPETARRIFAVALTP
jgi:uncharacterized protein (TIGR03083 family)